MQVGNYGNTVVFSASYPCRKSTDLLPEFLIGRGRGHAGEPWKVSAQHRRNAEIGDAQTQERPQQHHQWSGQRHGNADHREQAGQQQHDQLLRPAQNQGGAPQVGQKPDFTQRN